MITTKKKSKKKKNSKQEIAILYNKVHLIL